MIIKDLIPTDYAKVQFYFSRKVAAKLPISIFEVNNLKISIECLQYKMYCPQKNI